MDLGVLHEVREAFRIRSLKLTKNETNPNKQTKKKNDNQTSHTHKALKLC